jgi:hypothetical protein
MIHTRFKVVFSITAFALLTLCMTKSSGAQVTHEIQVTLSHPFIVGNTTLPPGKYDFRMVPNSDLSLMSVTSADGNTATEFPIRDSEADHVPQHTELVFNRYGKEEYLRRIFEKGKQLGVSLEEPSRKELRLQQSGRHPVEHTESQ